MSAILRRDVEHKTAELKLLRGERAVLVGLLIECDKVLSTLEGESDEEAGLLAGLRDAILRATMPHRPDEDGLLAVRAGYGA